MVGTVVWLITCLTKTSYCFLLGSSPEDVSRRPANSRPKRGKKAYHGKHTLLHTMQEQEGCLKEGALLGELLDGVAPVLHQT